MKQLLKVGGYGAIILPCSILSNLGIYTLTREIIIKYFKLVGITEFGSNTFMATNTNTVTLFLERRSNSDHKNVENAVKAFFEKPRDVTVLGIEKAFSKYASYAYDVSLDDYISFISGKPSADFIKGELYYEYYSWFEKQKDVKKIKESKGFKTKNTAEQEKTLKELFYSKIIAVEKRKIICFLLLYGQKTLITKTGEKQEEKMFLGYEFSTSRGREGIKMLHSGTMLYDENDQFNSEKASYYTYRAFLGEYEAVEKCLVNNIVAMDTISLVNFETVQFDLSIEIGTKQSNIESKWKKEKLGKCIIAKGGNTFPKEFQGGTDINNTPFLKVSDMNTNENWRTILVANNYVDEETILNKLSATVFEKGNIIFPKVGMAIHTNKKRILGRNSCVDNNIMSVEVVDKSILNNEYLYEIFKYYIQLKYFASSANPPSIMTDKLLDYKIPIPPLDIQNKIVEEVKKIEEYEIEAINKCTEYKRTLNNEEWFSYQTKRIEQITNMVQRGKSASYGDSNVQIIKSGQARGYNLFDFSKKYYVSRNFVSDERNLQKGDILINSTGVGTAGRVTLFELEGEFVADSHITIVRLNQERAIPKYVLYALANIGFKTIEDMANGQSGQIELSLPTVNGIKVPLPSLDVQKDIVNKIEKIEKKIKTLEDDIVKADEQKKIVLTKYLQ